jgi:hypothetical protein
MAALMRTGGFGQGRAVEHAGDVSGTAAASRAVECDPTALGVFSTGAFGYSLDLY